MRARKMKDKAEHEFYATPIEAVELAKPLMDKNLSWWEPCAGDGAISNTLDIDYSSDIKVRFPGVVEADVLTCDKPEGVNAMITNPPFTLGDEMVRRALFEWNIPCLMLMRVEYMSGKNRMDIRKHLTKMHIISDLVKFKTEDGRIINGNGTGRVAWMLFEPNKTVKNVKMQWVLYK